MAARTGIWGIVVIALMACVAIIGDRDMRPGKGVNRIVDKGGGHPSRFGVTLGAIRW
jgi:hypothetical protein